MSEPKPGQPGAPQLTVDKDLALGEYANFVSIAHNFTEVLLDFMATTKPASTRHEALRDVLLEGA